MRKPYSDLLEFEDRRNIQKEDLFQNVENSLDEMEISLNSKISTFSTPFFNQEVINEITSSTNRKISETTFAEGIKPKTFQCTQCSATQDTFENYKFHMRNGKCGVMSKYYRKDGKKKRKKAQTKFFTRTRQRVDKSNDYEITCNYCDYTTTSSNAHGLKRHIKVLHVMKRTEKLRVDDGRLKQNKLQCPFCDFNSSKNPAMVLHITQSHIEPLETDHGETKAKVNKTSTSGPSNIDLKNSSPVFATKSKPTILPLKDSNKEYSNRDIKCPQCNFVTGEKTHLEEHIQTEHAKMRNVPYAIVFACAECDFGTLDENTLKGHMTSVHQHDICSTGFSSEPMGVYQSAKETHISDKMSPNPEIYNSAINDTVAITPENSFKCESCVFATSSKFNLLQHTKFYCPQDQILRSKRAQRGCNSQRQLQQRASIIKDNMTKGHRGLGLDPDASIIQTDANVEDIHKRKRSETKKDPSPTGMFYCSSCPYETLNKTSIVAHNNKVHGNTSKILDCKPKAEQLPLNLLAMSKPKYKKINEEDIPIKAMYKKIKAYKNVDPGQRFKCPVCEHRASQKDNMQTHVKNVHYQIRDHPCKQCDFAAKGAGSLMQHIKKVHEKEKNFACEYLDCPYKAFSKVDIIYHVKRVHIKIKDISCSEDGCNYKASTKGALAMHLKGFHYKIRDKVCGYENCDFKTTLGSDLKRHVKAVHIQIQLNCKQCEYTTVRDSNLTMHIRTVHEVRNFDKGCEICGYATDKEYKLKQHMKKVHENSKSFVCEVCLKYSTDDFSKLKRHIKLRHKTFNQKKRRINRRRNIVTMSSESDSEDGTFLI